MAVEVNTCCGFIDLRRGCFIIGYLQLVGLVLATAVVVSNIVLAASLNNVPNSNESSESIYMSIVIVCVIAIFLLTLMTIFTTLLLIGLHKKKPGFLTAYLVYSIVYHILYIIGFVLALSHGAIGYPIIISHLISLTLGIYFMLVIKSYQTKLRTELGRPIKF